jgi:hypothetical protein
VAFATLIGVSAVAGVCAVARPTAARAMRQKIVDSVRTGSPLLVLIQLAQVLARCTFLPIF